MLMKLLCTSVCLAIVLSVMEGQKSVVMKTMGNYKLQVTVMFAVLADGSKLSTYNSKPQNIA